MIDKCRILDIADLKTIMPGDTVRLAADPNMIGEIREIDHSGFVWVVFPDGQMGWYKLSELELVSLKEVII